MSDLRTREGQEAWCIARIKRNPVITDWEVTEYLKRAAAWCRLYGKGIIRKCKRQPQYPYNRFKICKPFDP